MASYTAPRPRTILGPLTTTFTPADHCFTPFVACASCTYGFMLQSCASSHTVDDSSSCWPTTSAGLATSEPPLNGWGFYSPGLHCPVGHTAACSATAGGLSDWDMQFLMVESETAVGCCLSGFTCGVRGAQSCISTITAQTLTAIRCHDLDSNYTNIITASNNIIVYAPMIQINWRAEDLASASATATGSETNLNPIAETGTGTASTGTSATQSVNTGSSSSNSSGSLSGISTGAAVGIAVAATAVGIMGMVGAFLLWRRRRKQRAEVAENASRRGWSQDVEPKALGGYQGAPAVISHEMDSSPRLVEMDGGYER